MNAQYIINFWNLKSHRSQFFFVCFFLESEPRRFPGKRNTLSVFSSHPSRHQRWKTWLSEALGKQMPHTLSLSQAQTLPTPAFLELVPFPFAEAERVVQSWHCWASGCLGPGWVSPWRCSLMGCISGDYLERRWGEGEEGEGVETVSIMAQDIFKDRNRTFVQRY